LIGGFFVSGRLETHRLNDLVTEEPATSDNCTTAAKQHNDNNADNESSVTLLGFFGWGNRHFIHNFFSL
jgi:hypothetical protein